MKRLFLPLSLICLMYGCRKADMGEQSVPKDFVIVNKYGETMFLNVYDNVDNYNKDTVAIRIAVPANGNLTMTIPYFAPDRAYWIDWYNKDMTISNWAVAESNTVVFGQDKRSYVIERDDKFVTGARKVWLKSGRGSVWKAVGAYRRDFSGNFFSAWWMLADSMKNRQLTLAKDMTAIYLMNNVPAQGTYTLTPAGNIDVTYNTGKPLAKAEKEFSPLGGPGSADTAAARFADDTATYYMMVRQ